MRPVLLRSVLLLAAALSLGGCVWGGPPLYDTRRSETPLPPGRYDGTLAGVETAGGRGRITVAGRVTSLAVDRKPPTLLGDERIDVLLIPFEAGKRRLWIVQSPLHASDEMVRAYGLLERTASGWAMEPLIECVGTEDRVRAAGGTIATVAGLAFPGDGVRREPACVFRTTAALEAAVRDVVGTRPLRGTLTRLGD